MISRTATIGAVAGIAAFGGVMALGWLTGDEGRPSTVSIDLAVPKPAIPPSPAAGEPAAGSETQRHQPASDRQKVSGGGAFTVPAVTPAAFAGLPAVSSLPLPAVPDDALVEERYGRRLPRIAADGRQPWRVYARPFDRRDDRSRIAIVITSLGLSATTTDAIIHYLPADITLAFDPYGENLDAWAAEARSAGHEILLGLPMHSTDFPFVDAGPQALSVSLRSDENRQRLDYLLGLFPGFVGVVSQPGSALTQNVDAFRPLLNELKHRGLLYLEAGQAAKTTTLPLAADVGAVRVGSDLWIDEELDADAIDERLTRLEALARSRFVAIGLTRPRPLVVQRLVAWAARLNPNELVLAPLSAVALAPIAH